MENYVLTFEGTLSFVDKTVFPFREAALMAAFSWAQKLETNIAICKFSDSGLLGKAEDIVEG